MSFATSGVGSQQQMVAEWFAKIAGIKLEHVPYRGGGQAINDLVAGHVKLASLGSSPLIPHYKAGTVRLLAQSTAAALAEPAGRADLSGGRHQGACARPVARRVRAGRNAGGGSAPPHARLGAEISKALADPAIAGHLLGRPSAQEPVGGSVAPNNFARLVRRRLGPSNTKTAGEGAEHQKRHDRLRRIVMRPGSRIERSRADCVPICRRICRG